VVEPTHQTIGFAHHVAEKYLHVNLIVVAYWKRTKMTLRQLLDDLMGRSKFPVNGIINAALRMMLPKIEEGQKNPLDYTVLIDGQSITKFTFETHSIENGKDGFINIITHERLSSEQDTEA